LPKTPDSDTSTSKEVEITLTDELANCLINPPEDHGFDKLQNDIETSNTITQNLNIDVEADNGLQFFENTGAYKDIEVKDIGNLEDVCEDHRNQKPNDRINDPDREISTICPQVEKSPSSDQLQPDSEDIKENNVSEIKAKHIMHQNMVKEKRPIKRVNQNKKDLTKKSSSAEEPKETPIKSYSAAMKTNVPKSTKPINKEVAVIINNPGNSKPRKRHTVAKGQIPEVKIQEAKEENLRESVSDWKMPSKKGKKKHANTKIVALEIEKQQEIQRIENQDFERSSPSPLPDLVICNDSLLESKGEKSPDNPTAEESKEELKDERKSPIDQNDKENTPPSSDSKSNNNKRKKKKATTKNIADDSTEEKRIIICDNQIDIQQSAMKCFPFDLMQSTNKELLSGVPDVLVVSELGQGINRGFMGLGRLYQGKYIPPEREDISRDGVPKEEKCGDDAIHAENTELKQKDIDLD